MKVLLKTVFIMTMGGSLKDPVRQEQIDSIKCSMIGDRMFQRTCTSEFYVFDEMTRGYGNDENRLMRIDRFTKDIYQIGFNIEK
ncbi:MAG: hypothetical protein HGA25_00840 [Clostridiales bacterium]|nr:hypothetical protein [Clostridiales bacterium]